MKCTKCNNEIHLGSSMCLYCGTAVEEKESIKKIFLKCEHCSGTLVVDDDKTLLACPYCGYQTLIVENDAVTIERIKMSAHKEVEKERIRSNERIRQMEDEKNQKQEVKVAIENFKKSKLAKFLIVSFLLSALFAYLYFTSGRILAGVLSVVQAGCFGYAWCMGMNIIKEKKKYIHILITIIGIVLIVPTMRSCGSVNSNNNVEKIKWSIIFMGDKIPEPSSKRIEIYDNEENKLWIEVHNTSVSKYYEYINSCKDKGYTIVNDEFSNGYDSYNGEGYHLVLWYYESKKQMSIQLEAPTKVGELNWNTHKVASILPKPQSSIGTFTVENEKTNTIIISDTTQEAFTAYCNACKEVGFIVDLESKSESYAAYDENGNKIRVSYNNGNKEMTIVFEYPMVFKKITWPTVGVGTLAPIPNSLFGNVASDYEWAYSVYLENINKEEYEAYVQKCKDVGFSKNVRNYGDSVWADYSKDDDINIEIVYKGFNIMYVNVTGSLSGDYSSLKRKPGKNEEVVNDDSEKTENTTEYTIDYKDAASFEKALNGGKKVNGKIVCFEVLEYKPNSAMGINCWSGKHLNFISKTEPGVKKGDMVIGRIIAEPSKSLGSWKIPYEVLAINPSKIKDENTEESETAKKSETTKESEKITEAETIIKQSSVYEKAYIRKFSSYSLYMMFDEDTKEVVYFGTNDASVMKGTYSGSFSNGVTISWDAGWKEKFSHSGGNSATLRDGNGFDWEYKVCNVESAQKILDSLR